MNGGDLMLSVLSRTLLVCFDSLEVEMLSKAYGHEQETHLSSRVRQRVLENPGKETRVGEGEEAMLRGREDGRNHRAGKGGGVLLRAVVLAETLLLVPMSLSSYASPPT